MPLKEIWIETDEDYTRTTKKYKRGYNKELDAVIISKDGTLGKIVVIDGLRIGLPAVPKSKKNILNWNKKVKENRVWERTPLPKELESIELYDHYMDYAPAFRKKWDKYIEQEFKRRTNGVHIHIGDEIVYLTGRNYMFLQWNSLGGNRYPKYRFAQMVLWTHWEACVADDRCFGQCYLKNRRSGYSTMNSSDCLDFATSNEFVNVGIMSKTGLDAKKMFTGMIVPTFWRYPFFFKPMTEGSTSPKAELVFKEPSQKVGKQNKVMKAGGGLNSTLGWWNTGLNSMDGMHIEKMGLDEIGKFPKDVPFNEYWRIAMECLTEGGDITGKAMVGSTANSFRAGGKEFHDVYHNSKVDTRSEHTGRTRSGLYSLFIPAEYNLSKYMDIYGMPITEDSEKGILNEKHQLIHKGSVSHLKGIRDALKNSPEDLNEELRKHPSTENHAFRNPSADSNFNTTKIQDQLEFNANMKTSKVVRGRFEWVTRDEEVAWIPDPKGKCIMRWMPKNNQRNQYEMVREGKSPKHKNYIVGGIDSYDISKVVDGQGSNGAMHIYLKNGFDQSVHNEFVLEYVDRPATAEMFFENCLKIAFFYGAEILIENNKARILYHFKNRGYRAYSADRPDRTRKRMSKTERELGGIPNSSNEVKLWHAEGIASYIEHYVGTNLNEQYREYGAMGDCYLDDLLNDWLQFDINDRTQFDRTISSGLCLMLANKNIKETKKADVSKSYNYFPTYKVRG